MYLTKYPDSIIACNLKACNRFRLFDRRTAELDIKNLIGNSGSFGSDLIKHNLVVFRSGEGALQVFPMLIDIIPEARLNLAIYYLRGGDVSKAEDLMKDVQPSVSYEYILKGAVHAVLGQQTSSVDQSFTLYHVRHELDRFISEKRTSEERSAIFAFGWQQCR